MLTAAQPSTPPPSITTVWMYKSSASIDLSISFSDPPRSSHPFKSLTVLQSRQVTTVKMSLNIMTSASCSNTAAAYLWRDEKWQTQMRGADFALGEQNHSVKSIQTIRQPPNHTVLRVPLPNGKVWKKGSGDIKNNVQILIIFFKWAMGILLQTTIIWKYDDPEQHTVRAGSFQMFLVYTSHTWWRELYFSKIMKLEPRSCN